MAKKKKVTETMDISMTDSSWRTIVFFKIETCSSCSLSKEEDKRPTMNLSLGKSFEDIVCCLFLISIYFDPKLKELAKILYKRKIQTLMKLL